MAQTSGGLTVEFEAFRRSVDALVVGLMPITQNVDDHTYFGQGHLVGDPSQVRALEEAIVGKPLNGAWSPAQAPRGDMNRFVLPLQRDRERVQPYLRLYGTSQANDTMRMLVYDGAVCIGWFGCLRARDAPDFDRQSLNLAQEHADRWVTELAARNRRDNKLLQESPAHIVVAENGQILAATPEVAPWLSRRRARTFANAAREIRRTGPMSHVVGSYLFRGVELHSDDSSLVYFNAPLGTFGNVALAALTPRQIQVARLIAVGLSAAECAEELGVALPTVKQHLANVYRLVNVSRREELVAIMSSRAMSATKEASR